MQVIQLTENIKKEIIAEYFSGVNLKILRAKYPLPRGQVKGIILAALTEVLHIPEVTESKTLADFGIEELSEEFIGGSYKDVDDGILATEFSPEGDVILESSSTIIEPAKEPAKNHTEEIEVVEIPAGLTAEEPAKTLLTNQEKSVAAAKALAKKHRFKKTV